MYFICRPESVETGALLVYSCLITFKRFRQWPISKQWTCWFITALLWIRVNRRCMFLVCFIGKLFENGKRYKKSDTPIKKALEERIPNHILHVQFERKTSVSQLNLLYPIYRVYVYNYLKRQKMPKRVKMFTLNMKRDFYLSVCTENGTESNNTFSDIILDHSNAFGLSRIFLSRTSLPESILCGERGVNFQLFPLLWPPGIWTGPNRHMHNLAMGPTI